MCAQSTHTPDPICNVGGSDMTAHAKYACRLAWFTVQSCTIGVIYLRNGFDLRHPQPLIEFLAGRLDRLPQRGGCEQKVYGYGRGKDALRRFCKRSHSALDMFERRSGRKIK